MKRLFILLFLPVVAFGKTITTPSKAIVGVNATDAVKRVCWYQDSAYSEGAILQVGEFYIKCQAANDFETNGALKWVSIANDAPAKN
ncbi:DUF1496 domain-containing protein [Vibrio sonorensis]|uniref:DUF1496 domain-containing protein n=1 Tax=Vibrio sonorensis TaxID=1004316 RepID=UPI0008D9E0ED|nr:DUF1496 domain-containing protein [Vibrio sonorensis]